MNEKNPPNTLGALALPNAQQPSSTLVTGGAPDVATLKAAADTGIRYVFDLRPSAERSFDEPAVVTQNGMEFLHLPIAGPPDLTLANVRIFNTLLARIGSSPAIIHCASGNRVGAMMALRARWLNDVPADKALEIGRAHGLTKMEATVADLLERGPV